MKAYHFGEIAKVKSDQAGRGPGRGSALAIAIVFFLMGSTSSPSFAQPNQIVSLTSQQAEQAENIFGIVMSPYCPGRLLRDCPSGKAEELRDKIKSEVKAGKGEDMIMSELATQYGTDIYAVPPVTGFAALAWAGPVVFLLLGAFVIGGWLRRSRS